jgi:hypothetical protein
LGSDGQKRLAAETAIAGGNPKKDYVDIILEAFNLHTDYELTADFDKSASDFDPDGDGKGNNPADALTESTLPIEVAMGNLTETIAYISPVAQRVSDKSQMAFKA